MSSHVPLEGSASVGQEGMGVRVQLRLQLPPPHVVLASQMMRGLRWWAAGSKPAWKVGWTGSTPS